MMMSPWTQWWCHPEHNDDVTQNPMMMSPQTSWWCHPEHDDDITQNPMMMSPGAQWWCHPEHHDDVTLNSYSGIYLILHPPVGVNASNQLFKSDLSNVLLAWHSSKWADKTFLIIGRKSGRCYSPWGVIFLEINLNNYYVSCWFRRKQMQTM